VSGASTAWFIYTDSRNGAGCSAVDAYQTYLADNGLAQPDETDGGKDTGKSGTGASTVAVATPAPPTDCPSQFGNTDVYSVGDPALTGSQPWGMPGDFAPRI
jgi:hypothetical protein